MIDITLHRDQHLSLSMLFSAFEILHSAGFRIWDPYHTMLAQSLRYYFILFHNLYEIDILVHFAILYSKLLSVDNRLVIRVYKVCLMKCKLLITNWYIFIHKTSYCVLTLNVNQLCVYLLPRTVFAHIACAGDRDVD